MLTGSRVLLTLIAVFTAVAPYLADWNVIHVFNPLWPPHAKFHNAQTLSIATLLGVSILMFVWSGGGKTRANLLPALVIASFYWASQALALLYPDVAWTDPNLLRPGQSLPDFPVQLGLGLVMFALLALTAFLVVRGTRRETAAP